jgi:DNA-binding transcriptional regulator YiaG
VAEILVATIQANTLERWEFIRADYRFSQPDEPAALVLPQTHRMHSRNRAPEQLITLDGHMLHRRLTLKLLQWQVAEQLGVDNASILNWETHRTKPEVK